MAMNSYDLANQTAVTISSVGAHYVSLSGDEIIPVQAGDVIGIAQEAGKIAHSLDVKSSAYEFYATDIGDNSFV